MISYAQLPLLTALEKETLRDLVVCKNMWCDYTDLPNEIMLEGKGCIISHPIKNRVAVTYFGLEVYREYYPKKAGEAPC